MYAEDAFKFSFLIIQFVEFNFPFIFGKAQEEADKLISSAKATIEGEKRAAMNEIKTYSAEIALQVAEKILRENLSSEAKQKELADKYVDEINLN